MNGSLASLLQLDHILEKHESVEDIKKRKIDEQRKKLATTGMNELYFGSKARAVQLSSLSPLKKLEKSAKRGMGQLMNQTIQVGET